MTDREQFLAILFRPGEATCFGETPNETSVSWLGAQIEAPWVCVNPLDPTIDHCPVEEYHRPDRPRRADCNVVARRNFLIEFDNGTSLSEQMAAVEKVGLPWSTCVFSGSKSYHFVVALEDALTAEEYRAAAYRLYPAIPQADQKTKNPSRFTRLAGAENSKTGKTQELVGTRGRVSVDEFFAWLDKVAPAATAQPRRFTNAPTNGWIPVDVAEFLRCGATEGGRTNAVYRAACALFRAGYDEDWVLWKCAAAVNFSLSDEEIRRTVRSARVAAQR
jgi:hypothetical protein